jgi:AGCS family alanine or glycine:cation symporter
MHKLPQTLFGILTDAFTPRAIGGGVLGAVISRGMQEGFSRGLLSNEAGAGTSAYSHTASSAKNPIRCGLFGAMEVIFDTVVLCMETAIMILISGTESQHGMAAIAKTLAKYTAGSGGVILFVCIALFATATVLCWYCYGTDAATYLFGKRGKRWFVPLFFAAFILGLTAELKHLLPLTDLILLFLTLLCTLTLIKSSDRIVSLSEQMINR